MNEKKPIYRSQGWFSIPWEIRQKIYQEVEKLIQEEEMWNQAFDRWHYKMQGWDEGRCNYWKRKCFRCNADVYLCDIKQVEYSKNKKTRMRYCFKCQEFIRKYMENKSAT